MEGGRNVIVDIDLLDLNSVEAARYCIASGLELRRNPRRDNRMSQSPVADALIRVGMDPDRLEDWPSEGLNVQHVVPVRRVNVPGVGTIDHTRSHHIATELPLIVRRYMGRAPLMLEYRQRLAQALASGGMPEVWSTVLKGKHPRIPDCGEQDPHDLLPTEPLSAEPGQGGVQSSGSADLALAQLVWGIVLEDLAVRLQSEVGSPATAGATVSLDRDQNPVGDGAFKDARDALLAAYNALQEADRSGCMRLFDARQPEWKYEIRLVLLHVGKEHHAAIEPALYLWLACQGGWSVKRPVDAVIRLRDGAPDSPCSGQDGLIILGTRSQAAVLDEIVGGLAELPHDQGGLQFSYRESDCRRLEVKTVSGVTEKLLDSLCDRALDAMLVGNRPTLAWRTSFLQAVRFRDECELLKALQTRIDNRTGLRLLAGDGDQSDQDLAVSHFLLPHVRKVLAPDRDTAENQARKFADGECRALVSLDCMVSEDKFELAFEPGVESDNDGRYAHDGKSLHVPIRSLRLHLFNDRTALLEWTVGRGPDDAKEAGAVAGSAKLFRDHEFPAWRRFLRASIDDKVSSCWFGCESLAAVLDLNAHLRMTFSPFKREDQEVQQRGLPKITLRYDGKPVTEPYCLYERVESDIWNVDWLTGLLTLALCSPASGHAMGTAMKPHCWDTDDPEQPFRNYRPELMAALGPVGRDSHESLISDRSRVITSVVLDGGMAVMKQTRQHFDWMLGRLAMADGFGEGAPYDTGFSSRELAQARYDRFSEFGSETTVTDHCIAYMGYGADYALSPIHVQHMKYQYHRLALIGFAYQAMLSNLSLHVEGRIGARVDHAGGHGVLDRTDQGQRTEELRRRTKKLRERVVEFTNVLWFREVCSQVQGREIFAQFWRQARMDQEFGFITDEISRYEEMSQAEEQVEENRKARKTEANRQALTLVGVPAAIYAFLVSTIEPGTEAIPIWWLLGHGGEWMPDVDRALPGAWLWILTFVAVCLSLNVVKDHWTSAFSTGSDQEPLSGSSGHEVPSSARHLRPKANVTAIFVLASVLGWLLFHGWPAWITAVPFCGALGLMILSWNTLTAGCGIALRWGSLAAMIILIVGLIHSLSLSASVPGKPVPGNQEGNLQPLRAIQNSDLS